MSKLSRIKFCWVVFSFIFVISVGSTKIDTAGRRAYQPQRESVATYRFGLGYAVKGYAKLAAQTGAKWIRVPLVAWGAIEPEPPTDGEHHYRWERLDELIHEYQANGFEVQLILKAANPWACQGYENDAREAFRRSYPPKDEYWDDYSDFVHNLVERYDGDGYKDAPNLLAPVRYYEVESEAQNEVFWAGTFDDYRKLLKTAHEAAKQADSSAKIILSGINFGRFIENCRSESDIDRLSRSLPPRFKRVYDFIVQSLALGDFYDIVDVHLNRGYESIPLAVNWIRTQLAKYGYDKPIWAGDVCSVPWVTDRAHRRILQAIVRPNHPKHDDAIKWLRAEQARLSVKKLVVCAACGTEAFFLETLRDFSPNAYKHATRESFFLAGLIGKDKKPRPASYAYKQAIEKLDGFVKVESQVDGGLYITKFYFTDRPPVWVVWSEDGEVDVTLDVEADSVRIEKVITELPPEPEVETKSARDGKVMLDADETPIFVKVLK